MSRLVRNETRISSKIVPANFNLSAACFEWSPFAAAAAADYFHYYYYYHLTAVL